MIYSNSSSKVTVGTYGQQSSMRTKPRADQQLPYMLCRVEAHAGCCTNCNTCNSAVRTLSLPVTTRMPLYMVCLTACVPCLLQVQHCPV